MSLLFRIVYAAHANGTHHKLALDGLRAMADARAEGWSRLFLKHADRFMTGSKAPDDTFKDFKNHVLHVGDNFWGGAPEKTVEWYGRTVAALKEQRWEDAVYAAGVTSHYYTDPIMPFHTGQTDAENAIHRAAEWSINRSYNDLRQLGLQRSAAVEVPQHDGADWLKAMVCDGAETSHRDYTRLIAHYDIHRGVTDPPAGLDGVARSMVAELLVYAATGYGRILDRAVAEAGVAPPDVALTLDTVMAAVKIPAKALAKRLSNAEDRAIVEAMYDELKATGRVDKTLPEDDRMVRDLHAKEVLAPKLAGQAAARAARIKASPTPQPAAATASAAMPVASPAPVGERHAPPAPPREQPAIAAHASAALKPVAQPAAAPSVSLVSRLATEAAPVETAAQPVRHVSVPQISRATDPRAPRIFLAAGDLVEAAPSIGPRMAERLDALGIKTVADFLACDPAATASRLADRRIDGRMLETWQAQARLVMSVAGLRGSHAQMLTGAGYHTVDAITAADPAKLSAAVLQFAGSPDGRRLLRDGDIPDLDKIKGWVDLARAAKAA